MKIIKKIKDVGQTLAKVLNAVSTSTTDTYSANFINTLVENSGGVDYIFNWDGLSSTNNADNIKLFQAIYDKQKETNVLVITKGVGTMYKSSVFSIGQNDITSTDGTKSCCGCVFYISNGTNNGYTSVSMIRPYLSFTLSNGEVTSVNGINTGTTISGGDYLSTSTNYSKLYTPLYNGSPATKKYVDDLIVDDEKNVSSNTELIIEDEDVMNGSEVVNSLAGNETYMAPSVKAVNDDKAWKVLKTNVPVLQDVDISSLSFTELFIEASITNSESDITPFYIPKIALSNTNKDFRLGNYFISSYYRGVLITASLSKIRMQDPYANGTYTTSGYMNIYYR